ncbi:MAG: hypothetical protein KJP14_01380 [Eudoraea sp.]|nr:hypothetical protein [Eudoraea sp.]MBT8209156.1 hypothetical protein [Eudoraea sp.]NNK29647.1 hypothetical protein [Flavobacteriaceae bacterium]
MKLRGVLLNDNDIDQQDYFRSFLSVFGVAFPSIDLQGNPNKSHENI